MKTINGQSLFELVLAIGLVALILVVLVSLSTLSVRNAGFARNQAEAARYGQEAIEWLRGERDKDWNAFLLNIATSPTRSFKTLSWANPDFDCNSVVDRVDGVYGIFCREVDFTVSDENGDGRNDLVNVVVRVFWKDSQGDREIRNTTDFADWRLE